MARRSAAAVSSRPVGSSSSQQGRLSHLKERRLISVGIRARASAHCGRASMMSSPEEDDHDRSDVALLDQSGDTTITASQESGARSSSDLDDSSVSTVVVPARLWCTSISL